MIYGLLLLAALSNWAAIEAFHHGSLFARLRGWLEACGGFVSELLLCPFCLSYWTGAVLAVVISAWESGLELQPRLLILWPIYWLTITRLSNVLNDLCRPFCRTPNRHMEELDDLARISTPAGPGGTDSRPTG
jgi:hypothetical protein